MNAFRFICLVEFGGVPNDNFILSLDTVASMHQDFKSVRQAARRDGWRCTKFGLDGDYMFTRVNREKIGGSYEFSKTQDELPWK
jgi:hypothetical protein